MFGMNCRECGRRPGGAYLTAYQIALKYGFKGTEEQWIRSIGTRRIARVTDISGNTFECDTSLGQVRLALEQGYLVDLVYNGTPAVITDETDDYVSFSTNLLRDENGDYYDVFTLSGRANTWERMRVSGSSESGGIGNKAVHINNLDDDLAGSIALANSAVQPEALFTIKGYASMAAYLVDSENVEVGDFVLITESGAAKMYKKIEAQEVTDPELALVYSFPASSGADVISLPYNGIGYAVSPQQLDTTARTAALEGYQLRTNGLVAVKFGSAVEGPNPTLNINDTYAVPMYHNGSALSGGEIRAGATALFVFDGSHYNLLCVDSANQNYGSQNEGKPLVVGSDGLGTVGNWPVPGEGGEPVVWGDIVPPNGIPYTDLAGNIPETKLDPAVQAKLDLANTVIVTMQGTGNDPLASMTAEEIYEALENNDTHIVLIDLLGRQCNLLLPPHIDSGAYTVAKFWTFIEGREGFLVYSVDEDGYVTNVSYGGKLVVTVSEDSESYTGYVSNRDSEDIVAADAEGREVIFLYDNGSVTLYGERLRIEEINGTYEAVFHVLDDRVEKIFRIDGLNAYLTTIDYTAPPALKKLGMGYFANIQAANVTPRDIPIEGFAPTVGGQFIVRFSNDVPAQADLTFDDKAQKHIYYLGSRLAAGVIQGGDIVTFVYDGTNYVVTNIDRRGLAVPEPGSGDNGKFLKNVNGTPTWSTAPSGSGVNVPDPADGTQATPSTDQDKMLVVNALGEYELSGGQTYLLDPETSGTYAGMAKIEKTFAQLLAECQSRTPPKFYCLADGLAVEVRPTAVNQTGGTIFLSCLWGPKEAWIMLTYVGGAMRGVVHVVDVRDPDSGSFTVSNSTEYSGQMLSNRIYRIPNGNTKVTITSVPSQGESTIIFTTPSTIPDGYFTKPSAMKMPTGWEGVEASTRYEINVLDGYALVDARAVS